MQNLPQDLVRAVGIKPALLAEPDFKLRDRCYARDYELHCRQQQGVLFMDGAEILGWHRGAKAGLGREATRNRTDGAQP